MDYQYKVLHLLNTGTYSGAENVACGIIKMFQDEKVEMIYSSKNGQIASELERRNIPFVPMKKLSVYQLAKVIKKVKPDVIHAHDIRASIVSSFFYKKVKIVSHVHVNNDNMKVISLKSILYTLCSKFFYKIIWVSKSTYESFIFKNKIENKSLVLSNVIFLSDVLKKKKEDTNLYDFDLIYVGRITHQKNPDRLIKVFKELINIKNNIKIGVVGTGELFDDFVSKTENIRSNVCIMGFKDNPIKIMNDSKVMIMVSRFEGTPMCALEAMALGLPIVSTKTDGLNYLIKHNETGFLTDIDSELVNYICYLLDDKSIRNEFAENSKKRFKKICDIKKYKSELLKCYGIENR